MSRERIDKVLVELGLVKSRSQARLLVEEGVVYHRDNLITKHSQMVESDQIEVRKQNQFAGRGAHKIEKALREFSVDPKGKVVADVGASTGGFTDYVLHLGASYVYAIDVGHDQLAFHLRDDERVENLEGTNIRFPLELDRKVDLCVVDLSFISLKLTLETIFSLAKDGADIITLVKPQFEAGKERVGKNGIVKSDEIRADVLLELYDWCIENSMYVKNATVSPITGKSGNIEYFFHFVKGNKTELFNREELRCI